MDYRPYRCVWRRVHPHLTSSLGLCPCGCFCVECRYCGCRTLLLRQRLHRTECRCRAQPLHTCELIRSVMGGVHIYHDEFSASLFGTGTSLVFIDPKNGSMSTPEITIHLRSNSSLVSIVIVANLAAEQTSKLEDLECLCILVLLSTLLPKFSHATGSWFIYHWRSRTESPFVAHIQAGPSAATPRGVHHRLLGEVTETGTCFPQEFATRPC